MSLHVSDPRDFNILNHVTQGWNYAKIKVLPEHPMLNRLAPKDKEQEKSLGIYSCMWLKVREKS